MKCFIDKEDLIHGLQNIKIDADCASKVMEMIYNLPIVQGQCGICKRFERYNFTRGFCNKHKYYTDYTEFCSEWESGAE